MSDPTRPVVADPTEAEALTHLSGRLGIHTVSRPANCAGPVWLYHDGSATLDVWRAARQLKAHPALAGRPVAAVRATPMEAARAHELGVWLFQEAGVTFCRFHGSIDEGECYFVYTGLAAADGAAVYRALDAAKTHHRFGRPLFSVCSGHSDTEIHEQKPAMPPRGRWLRWVRGVTREVVLVGPLAIKVPSVRGWRLFLTGLLANLHERLWWHGTNKDPRLNRVYFMVPGGFALVARRVAAFGPDAEIDYSAFDGLPQDHKPQNFGMTKDERVVLLDYGN